jgi:hypothetical protein
LLNYLEQQVLVAMNLATKRVYLAGPEVFLLNAKEMGEQKKIPCKKYGFEGGISIGHCN